MAKEPVAQSVQKRLPKSEYFPPGQATQMAMLVAPTIVENVPAGQSTQPWPFPSPYRPLMQLSQSPSAVDPSEGTYLPLGHAWQRFIPVSSAKVLLLQSTHVEALVAMVALDTFPRGH